VRKADNLPPSCAVVTKSGNLNFLQPSGPVQACNGTALPLNVVGMLHFMKLNTRQIISRSSVDVTNANLTLLIIIKSLFLFINLVSVAEDT